MAADEFARFVGAFAASPRGPAGPVWREQRLMRADGYEGLASRFAGCSFSDGLYRLHDARSGPLAQEWVGEAFPEFAGRVCPFGFDWLGRQFALDSNRTTAGQPLVLLLEPGTGESLEVPLPFAAFHNEELVDYRDAALASGFFAEWAAGHAEDLPLPADRCVGYRVPLFLGGNDGVDNLEVVDLGVYWSICGQLRRGTMSLPKGASIKDVSGG